MLNMNKTILRALKGNMKAVHELQENGFYVSFKGDSEQGYPTVEHNGVELVISKDMEGKTRLYANNHWTADFKQLKHVDYMNLIRMTNERRTNQEWFVDPLIKARMKRRDLIMNKREAESIRMMIDRKQQEIKELQEKLERLGI